MGPDSVDAWLDYIWASNDHPVEPHLELWSGDFGEHRYMAEYYGHQSPSNSPKEAVKSVILAYEEEGVQR